MDNDERNRLIQERNDLLDLVQAIYLARRMGFSPDDLLSEDSHMWNHLVEIYKKSVPDLI